jgi:putative sterol carrier protein
MPAQIFDELEKSYRKGTFSVPTVFYFSVDELKKTLTLDGEGCTVSDGKPAADADCVCKTSTEMFRKIWHDGYRPGIMDFMGGKIKSNQPQLLQQFLQAFGK